MDQNSFVFMSYVSGAFCSSVYMEVVASGIDFSCFLKSLIYYIHLYYAKFFSNVSITFIIRKPVSCNSWTKSKGNIIFLYFFQENILAS
jgi:hypothetical protein